MAQFKDAKNPDGEAGRRKKESARRWRAANRDKLAESNRTYREQHKDELREKRHKYYEEVAKPRERNRRKRYAAWRRRQQADPERERDRARRNQARYIERQLAEDPEGYRHRRNEMAAAYRAKNRDKLNAQKRERYRRDPERMRATTRAYLEKNREAVREQRHAYYQANREKILAANARWKQRERHRRANGLPPTRLHRITAQEKSANAAAADAFFSRQRTKEEVDDLRLGGPTPDHLIATWNQESERSRALHRYHADKAIEARLEREREALRVKEAAEEARMDAIARGINDRLRRYPRPSQAPAPYEWAPTPSTHQQPRGL